MGWVPGTPYRVRGHHTGVPGTPYRIIDDLQDIDSPSSCLDWRVLSHLESPTTSPRGETAGSRRSCATTLTGLTANGLATAQASRANEVWCPTNPPGV